MKQLSTYGGYDSLGVAHQRCKLIKSEWLSGTGNPRVDVGEREFPLTSYLPQSVKLFFAVWGPYDSLGGKSPTLDSDKK